MSDRAYSDMLNMIESFEEKPTLLLHVCCAPCSSHVLDLLSKYFKITIFYSNDNTYPESEFNKRLEYVKVLNEKMNLNLEVITDPYTPSLYDEYIEGLEELGEKSKRCYKCYLLRLEKTCKYAKENNFDYFTTTLSISPHKNSDWINEIGNMLSEKYAIKFLYSNFKKDEGYKHSIALSKQYDLYRQEYCGCKYSLKEREPK